jgi:RNA polymerase sigma factor (sigma-70 family)
MPASAVRVLRAIAGDEGQSDGDLLGRFIDRRDEAAFTLLVRRHAPMVWGVCRRALPTAQDAEDAFQSTFLVLVEKARAVPREAVGNWLYGVARRAALLARRTLSRRRERPGEMGKCPAPEPLDDPRAVLDEELSRLPEHYRTVIVLCDLEGRTRREAAAALGWPEGTVAGRLVRARERLAKRLARHAPAVSVATILAGTASARVPEVLAPTAAVPSAVAALTREVLGVMVRGKLMKTAAVILLLGYAGLGMVLHAGQKPATAGAPVPAGTPVPAKPPKVDDVVWGEEAEGLQVGLAAGARTYQHGETIKMEVRLRNVGKAEVKVTHGLLRESAAQLTATDGVRMTVAMPVPLDFYAAPTHRVLKPGETITLYNPVVEVQSTDRLVFLGELRVDTPTAYLSPGKYKLAFGGMVQSHPKLATGAVEIEVREPLAADQEAFTAWGKEVGGLTAGVGYRPGEKRPYGPGQTVKLVVRVRNLGKEEVTFRYLKEFFIETPPTVTDDKGKAVPLGRRDAGGLVHVPVEVSLAPGKEVELAEVKLEPRTRTQSVREGQWNLFTTGTFGVQYEQLAYPDIDKVLGRLATGKLELKIKFPSPPAEPGKKDREDADTKPIKVRVYIEKVNADTSTITASCMLIGEIDNVTTPLRFENLRVSEKARITDGGKELRLADLKRLPRDTHFYLHLRAYSELGFEVVGIETIRR